MFKNLLRQPLNKCSFLESILGPILFGGGMGLASAIFDGGGTQTVRQETIPQRPQLTPQEQALQDYYIDLAMGAPGMYSPLQNLIQQYYGYGLPGVQQPMIPGQAIPPSPISYDTARGGPGRTHEAMYGAGAGMPAIPPPSAPMPTTGAVPTGTQVGVTQQYQGEALQSQLEKYQQALQIMQSGLPSMARAERAAKIAGIPITEFAGIHGLMTQLRPRLEQLIQDTQSQIAQIQAPTEPAAPTEPTLTPQEAQAQAILERQEAIAALPEDSPLKQIMEMSPEAITEKYNLLRQQQTQQIQDWYGQAQRELERRGIARGGLLGSGFERDVGGILGQRGRMTEEMTRGLGLAELAEAQQLPYQQLQALEDIRRWEASNILAQQAPWQQAGLQMLSVPWGQTAFSQTQMPGPGIIPGAISGLGLYGMGQQMGWWGQPSTTLGLGNIMGGPGGFGPTGGSMIPII